MVRERLTGLVLILAGLVGFDLAYGLWAFSAVLLPMPPPPPGFHPDLLPLLSPVRCLLPLVGLTSAALVLLGLRRLIFPE